MPIQPDNLDFITEIAGKYKNMRDMGLLGEQVNVLVFKESWQPKVFDTLEETEKYLEQRAIRDRSDIGAVLVVTRDEFLYAYPGQNLRANLADDEPVLAPTNQPHIADLWRYHDAAVQNISQ